MPVPPAGSVSTVRSVPAALGGRDHQTFRETFRLPRPGRLTLLVQTWGLGLAAVALTVGFLFAVSDLVARLA